MIIGDKVTFTDEAFELIRTGKLHSVETLEIISKKGYLTIIDIKDCPINPCWKKIYVNDIGWYYDIRFKLFKYEIFDEDFII